MVSLSFKLTLHIYLLFKVNTNVKFRIFFNEIHLPMSCPPKCTHTRRHDYESIQNILDRDLLKEELARSFLPPHCVSVAMGLAHKYHTFSTVPLLCLLSLWPWSFSNTALFFFL